jgi:hypothetical protein
MVPGETLKEYLNSHWKAADRWVVPEAAEGKKKRMVLGAGEHDLYHSYELNWRERRVAKGVHCGKELEVEAKACADHNRSQAVMMRPTAG